MFGKVVVKNLEFEHFLLQNVDSLLEKKKRLKDGAVLSGCEWSIGHARLQPEGLKAFPQQPFPLFLRVSS